jgi:predicted CoA-binding protein
MSSMAVIQDLLAPKRIAVVGVSHDPKDFSRGLLRTMRQGGYEAVALNPALTEADDASCFASLEDVTPPVDGGLLKASPATTESVVEDCASCKFRAFGCIAPGSKGGAVSPKAVEFCNEHEFL